MAKPHLDKLRERTVEKNIKLCDLIIRYWGHDAEVVDASTEWRKELEAEKKKLEEEK